MTNTKLAIILFACFFSFDVFSQRVRVYDFSPDSIAEPEYRLSVGRNTSSLQSIEVFPSSGDGTSSSSPFRGYVPVYSDGGGPNQRDYVILENPAGMPEASASDINLAIRFAVEITNNSSDDPLIPRAAIRSDGNYFVVPLIANPSSIPTGDIERLTNLTFNFGQACNTVSNTCDNFLNSSDGNRQRDFLVYFFATDEDLSIGDQISLDNYTNGIFYEFRLSDRVPTGSLSINQLNRGDGRLFLEFSGGQSINQMGSSLRHQTMIIDYNTTGQGTVTRTLREALDLGATRLRLDDEFAQPEGRYAVRSLTNGQTYDISMALVNRYGFASELSISRSGSPLEIEALLEEQSCFILTAGFQTDDPIIGFYRNFRDEFLAKSWPGTSVIRLYYRYGPNLAQWFLKYESAQFIVRGVAKALYFPIAGFLFAFHFIGFFHVWFIGLIAALGVGSVIVLRRVKFKILS